MFRIDSPKKSEYSRMLEVWESSVRFTHHFLQKRDIEFFKNTIIEKEVFDHLNLVVARDESGNIVGIMGLVEDILAMLFVDSKFIGKGVGKLLIQHAILNLNVTEVEVNEQNTHAVKFYKYFGFEVISRSELDDNGKPYPVLKMKRKNLF